MWTSAAFHVDRRFTMKYSKEQRMEIGRRIYEGELNRYQAAAEYGVAVESARNYLRLYRNMSHLPAKH